MNEDVFDSINDTDNYRYYLIEPNIEKNIRFYIITGTYSDVTSFNKIKSSPEQMDLPINSYIRVIVQTNNVDINNSIVNRFEIHNHNKLKQYIMPLSVAEDFLNLFLDKYKKENINSPQPCCKCKLNDHWNSLGKDNQWYCYLHCSY